MAYKAQQFIDAIPGTGGIISTIAKRVGCKWHTARNAIGRFPTVRAAYDDECEVVTDLAESVVIKSIREGDVGDAKWWLSRKGKDRGFVERREIEQTGDATIRLQWDDGDENDNAAIPPPGPTDDSPEPGEVQSGGGGQEIREDQTGSD